MKHILIFCSIFIVSCSPKVKTRVEVRDSIVYKLAPVSDSLLNECVRLNRQVDSLQTELFLSQFRINRVEHYVGIVDHNPSQLKFLRGWIKRAIQ